jgi:hypothetical protein
MPDKIQAEFRNEAEVSRKGEPEVQEKTRIPLRDSQGRWRPGHCGNPCGRPKKLAALSDEEMSIFSRRIVEVTQNGQTIKMSRKRALVGKLFEVAMKGKPSAIRMLLSEIQKTEELRAKAKNRLEHLEFEWTLAPDLREIPPRIQMEIDTLRNALSWGRSNRPFGMPPEWFETDE